MVSSEFVESWGRCCRRFELFPYFIHLPSFRPYLDDDDDDDDEDDDDDDDDDDDGGAGDDDDPLEFVCEWGRASPKWNQHGNFRKNRWSTSGSNMFFFPSMVGEPQWSNGGLNPADRSWQASPDHRLLRRTFLDLWGTWWDILGFWSMGNPPQHLEKTVEDSWWEIEGHQKFEDQG